MMMTPSRLCRMAALLASLSGTFAYAATPQPGSEALNTEQKAAVDARIDAWMQAHSDDISQQAAVYLASHPAFFEAAQENLKQLELAQLRSQLAQGALAARDTLLAPKALPQHGPDNAPACIVVVRMFPDMHGAQLNERLSALEKALPGVQVRWLDLPGQAPGSTQAAINALLAWKSKGEEGYQALIAAQLQGTGQDGTLTPADLAAALKAGQVTAVQGEKLKALAREAQEKLVLARTLRVRQVPLILVLPAQGGDPKQVSVFDTGIPSVGQLIRAWQTATQPPKAGKVLPEAASAPDDAAAQ
ncbi:hypothetical protein ABLU83_21800 [Klebsiella sp. CN_Kp098]|uniref:hypothetical protein n=1 Tax=unclassified Klebsiella TaxID=2608929 RepID=UPI0032B5872E